MTKEQLIEKILMIGEMGSMELQSFLEKVKMSDVGANSKNYLLRAIEIRMAELDLDSAMVECGEICQGEFR